MLLNFLGARHKDTERPPGSGSWPWGVSTDSMNPTAITERKMLRKSQLINNVRSHHVWVAIVLLPFLVSFRSAFPAEAVAVSGKDCCG